MRNVFWNTVQRVAKANFIRTTFGHNFNRRYHAFNSFNSPVVGVLRINRFKNASGVGRFYLHLSRIKQSPTTVYSNVICTHFFGGVFIRRINTDNRRHCNVGNTSSRVEKVHNVYYSPFGTP